MNSRRSLLSRSSERHQGRADPLENLVAAARLAEEELSQDDALDALEQVGLAGPGSGLQIPLPGAEAARRLARLVRKSVPCGCSTNLSSPSTWPPSPGSPASSAPICSGAAWP